MIHPKFKKVIIIAIALLPFWLYGQTTFIPVLTEGKSWEVARLSNHPLDYPEKMDTINIYAITVSGDTIVNNFTCKKIEIVSQNNKNQSKTAVAYEENGKVWNIREDGEMELLFDIGLHIYDEINTGYVIEEDYISVNGVNRKRLYIDTGIDSDFNYEYLYYYIVEGIGANNNIWIGSLIDDIGPCVMLSCSDNGETIFTCDDFKLKYQYMPLVKDGKKWVEYYENKMFDNIEGIICYQLSGVTDINGITYHNLYATINRENISSDAIPIAYVREQDKKVYAITNWNNGVEFPDGYNPLWMEKCQYNASTDEYLIYVFNDITSPYEAGSFTGDVETTETEVNGQLVNVYSVPTNEIIYFEDDKDGFIVQEGVGTLHEVFINPWPQYPTNALKFNLAWVEDEGNYLYKGAYFDKAHRIITGVSNINGDNQVAGVRYYNIAGVESAVPQQGVNIRVTTYSDGSRHTDKIIR